MMFSKGKSLMSNLSADVIQKKISTFLKVAPEKVVDATELRSLVTNSFILIELVIELQNEFDLVLNQQDLIGVSTVGDLIKVLQAKAT